MPDLVVGPMLRFASRTEATVWMETDGPCEVDVLGRRARTFHVEGHHYALVVIDGLEPGSAEPYEVRLDGELRWPPYGSSLPPCRLRTLPGSGPLRLVFGSCRAAAPHVPPFSLSAHQHDLGLGVDALYALAVRMQGQDEESWPHMIQLLGDQVYADDVSPDTLEFIRGRRDVNEPPGEEVADFQEYSHLYQEAWSDPTMRWLFSTVPTAMVFDDHDVHDDWNTSEAWVEEMRAKPWWHERLTSALIAYWIYQHLGNLSPAALEGDRLYQEVLAADDAAPVLREWAAQAEKEGGGGLWSFSRDLGGTRLVVLDGREGRVLTDGRREMMDEEEWRWLEEQVSGDFDHVLIGNTLPVLLSPALHYAEAWNEAVCSGAWGKTAARLGERVRQGIDLEHWSAFRGSFDRLIALVREVGAGRRGRPPASIILLGGDIHVAYLQEVAFRRGSGVRSAVFQAVCSPFRKPLNTRERVMFFIATRSRTLRALIRGLARAAGVPDPEIRWRFAEPPTFENQVATLELDGRNARLWIETTTPDDVPDPGLEASLSRRLA
jgi:PhoD-like phosphatase